jgi:hypothetical protein
MTTTSDQPRQPEPTDRRRLSFGVGWTLLVLALCLFVPAGTWAWARGWLFLAVVVAIGVGISLYLRRVNPDVVAARVNRHEGTKRWDRRLVWLFILVMASIHPVAALDDRRFRSAGSGISWCSPDLRASPGSGGEQALS